MKKYLLFLSTIVAVFHTTLANAELADVIDVSVKCTSKCTFTVTVKHKDAGWKHYANRWDVLSLDGKVIATRILLHPHVNEQPFTRSLDNVSIPESMTEVILRAHDLVHGYGGKEIKVSIPQKN